MLNDFEFPIAFGALSMGVVGALVWYLLRDKRLASGGRLHLSILVLFFFTMAAGLSFMLFNALAHGEAYGIGSRDTGKLYPVSREPVFYWFLVVVYWGGAVAALSFGLAAGLRLLYAEPASENAAGSQKEMNDARPQPFERLARYAAIAYLAAVLIAISVFLSLGWELPSRNRVAAVLFAPVFLFFGSLALYTGEVGLKTRSGAPLAYWARVGPLLLLGVGLLLVGLGVAGPLRAQTGTPPDAAELTLLGLEAEAEMADVVRILGRPQSGRSYAHPNDGHGRYDELHFPHARVLIGPDGLKLGVKLIAAGPSTRRGLAVGDSAERALERYGSPDERTETQLRWRIATGRPRDNPRLVVEVRGGKVVSIFAGYVIEGLRPLPEKPKN